MKYGECEKQVGVIIANIIDEATEDESLSFDSDIERGVVEKTLRSEITLFIFSHFGLDADMATENKGEAML